MQQQQNLANDLSFVLSTQDSSFAPLYSEQASAAFINLKQNTSVISPINNFNYDE